MNRFLHSPEHELLRKLLIDQRKKEGLTQKSLADKLNKPQSYVSKYEIGEKNIDVIEFIKISQALNECPENIITEYLRNLNINPEKTIKFII